jgi:hypothetical protein
MVRVREFHDSQKRALETRTKGFGALRALSDLDATHTEAPPDPTGLFYFCLLSRLVSEQ